MNQQIERLVIPAVIIGGIFYLGGQYIASNPAREQQVVESGREITVTGQAELSVTPDIAKVTVGLTTQPLVSAEVALDQLAQSFTKVVDAVEGVGIDEKDVKTTNFSVSPQYDYTDGRQTLRGFIASEQVVVTVRDLEKIGEVISVATSTGANQIGGINFSVDDEESVRAQAEEQAIEQAREKAERIAKALGATLGDVKTYHVDQGGSSVNPVFSKELALGGDDAAVPPVPAGTNDVTVSATITFQLK